MAYDEVLAERVRQALTRRKGVVEKEMFGGVGFLLNGNLFVGVGKNSLIVRLGPEEGDEALKEPHVSMFRVSGRSMKGWLLVASDGVADDDRLNDWIQRAVKFVAKLPAKEK
jgi:TfoX/Sxy family transcriptional regulator of competence genes